MFRQAKVRLHDYGWGVRNVKYKVERRYTIVFPALLHCQPLSIFGGESERKNINCAGAVRVRVG